MTTIKHCFTSSSVCLTRYLAINALRYIPRRIATRSRMDEYQHSGTVIRQKDSHSITDCEACGYIHMMPLPDKRELEDYYTHSFYEERPLVLDKVKEDMHWLSLSYGQHYRFLERHLRGNKNILEIGCGIGTFLKIGQQQGWSVQGVEASLSASQYAQSQNIDVSHAFYPNTIHFHDEFVDVVHMDNVMEHLANPADILQQVRRLIKSQGLLSTITPNEFNPLQMHVHKKMDYPDWWIAPPLHVNYFSFDSMEKLLTDNGFEVLEKTPEGQFDTILCFGMLYYTTEPYRLLKLMRDKAGECILLDTFTAGYAAIQGKDALKIYPRVNDETLELPMALTSMTQAEKKDYRLPESFKHKGKDLSLTTFPTKALLEIWFESLGMKFKILDWSAYAKRKCEWRDLWTPEQKKSSHWADVYASGVRVSYRLERRKS